nr:LOW QUALITY PROTEIN: leukotriene B4 receptor 2 [Vicugna pacos]
MSVCYRPPGNETLLSSKTSRATGAAFLLLAALLGLPGNGFVVWSLAGWRPAGGRPLAATLVLHLALADGLVLLLTPLFVAFLTGKAWPLGQAGCKAVYYVCTLSMYASVLLTSLLSLQRCLAVTRPFLAPRLRSPALARRLLLAVWLAALVLASPVAVYRHRAPYHAVNVLQVLAALAPPEGALARLGGAGQAARAGTTALAFFSSSVNPVLYVFTARDLLPRAGPRFLMRLFEGSGEARGGGLSREGTMELRATTRLKVAGQGRGNGDPGGGAKDSQG